MSGGSVCMRSTRVAGHMCVCHVGIVYMAASVHWPCGAGGQCEQIRRTIRVLGEVGETRRGGSRASLLCVLTYSARSLAHVRRMHGGRYARNICLRQLISNVRTCARSHAIKSAIPPYQRTIHTVCTYVYHMLVRVCARHP